MAGQFWNAGHFYDIDLHDLDGDGVREILAAGVNNPHEGMGRGVLVRLRVPFVTADPAATDYLGNELLEGQKYVVFPRADIFDYLQQLPCARSITVASPQRITVDAGLVNYHFDFNLTLLGADIQHGIEQHHAELEDKLGHELGDDERADLRTVRYCTGVPDGNDDEDPRCGEPTPTILRGR